MVYDCFLFWKELDLLEIRLNVLNRVVDQFVIVESTKSFSGNKKELYYLNNIERFAPFRDKIRHIIVDDMPEFSGDRWALETFHRNALVRGIDTGADDYVMISDLDEIPNPEKVAERKHGVYIMRRYDYFLNAMVSQPWYGTYAQSASYFKNATPEDGRRSRGSMDPILNGGWHFSWIGSKELAKEKIEAFSHAEYDNDSIKNMIGRRIETLTDIMGRNNERMEIAPVSEQFLPAYLVQNQSKYAGLFYSA